MNEKKPKKVRAFLINFVNEELKKQKRNKKYDILINSTPLDILAKKNMQCKVFLIEEHKYFYQQNIDIGWMMGVNYDINKSNCEKNYINLFTNKITKELDKIDSSNGGEEKIEIINKETIIKKNLDSILYIHHQKDIGSPLGISLFQKKEISERKFIKENNGYHFSSKVLNFILNKSEREKGKEKDDLKLKDYTSLKDDNFFLIKRYSNITLETELSRIIKCCHEEDYQSSQEHCISDSKRSEINKELKIAKMYAKSLNLYCKKLKNKIDKKYINEDDNNEDVQKCDKNDKNNSLRKKNIKQKIEHCKMYIKKEDTGKKNKIRSHKMNNIKYTKIKPKRQSEKEKEHFSKFKKIEKSKTFIFNNRNSNRNNNLEHSSKIKTNYTFRENTILRKKSILKTNNNKQRNSLSIKLDRVKQTYFKSPKKGEHSKTGRSKELTSREYRKININENKLNNNNNMNQNKDEHIKKIIKKKKTQDHKNIEKTSLFRISKMKTIKRGSMQNDKMNRTELEKINFFKTKPKTSHEAYAVKAFHKKSPKKKDKLNLVNNINNNSTSISQRKDTSDSSEFNSQESDKKHKYKYIKKNSATFMKKKKDNLEGKENIKKFKKRKTIDYDNTIKIQKLKKIFPVKHIKDKRNHTTERHRHKFGKHEITNVDSNITDFDDFNVIDEFLYKIKIKRGKNNNGIEMN